MPVPSNSNNLCVCVCLFMVPNMYVQGVQFCKLLTLDDNDFYIGQLQIHKKYFFHNLSKAVVFSMPKFFGSQSAKFIISYCSGMDKLQISQSNCAEKDRFMLSFRVICAIKQETLYTIIHLENRGWIINVQEQLSFCQMVGFSLTQMLKLVKQPSIFDVICNDTLELFFWQAKITSLLIIQQEYCSFFQQQFLKMVTTTDI